jgi:nicotinate-nucleotide adenylyltransferase
LKRVGFFGGTFDPPHLGHLKLAQAALQELKLDKLIFCVANISPAKQNRDSTATPLERLKMVDLMINGQDKMQLSDFEVKRGGVSYTIDLVEHLERQYSGSKLFMVCAEDVYNSLAVFRDIERIRAKCTIVSGSRLPIQNETACRSHKISNECVDISSSEIRDRLQSTLEVKKYLAPKVFDFIVHEGLYL